MAAMPDEDIVVALPNPVIVLLVGTQGSGKSSFAHRHFARTEILARDAFRTLVCNDPSSQSNTATASGLMLAVLRARAANQVTTVIDSTNLRAEDRAAVIEVAAAHLTPTVALVLDVDVETCRHRVHARGRIIRDEVLDANAAAVRGTLDDLSHEGHLAVHVWGEQDIPRVRFDHDRPSDPDPGRWVRVQRLAPTPGHWTVPADDVRRSPTLRTLAEPGPHDVAVAAAQRVVPGADLGEVLRVWLPHCYPIDLRRGPNAWTAGAVSAMAGVDGAAHGSVTGQRQ